LLLFLSHDTIANMATDLTFGSVPPLYREVYEIVCPNQEPVDHDMFVKIMVKSGLSLSTLSQIWEAIGSKTGCLTRNSLYKGLALVALAQQGKTINDKILETYSDQELPKPSLGELADLKALSIRIRREKNPNVLGYNYQELCDFDSIFVELVPEKKGLLLKHVEYEVTSRKHKSTVLRRYSDFLAFQETLLLRYSYRMVPRLPPKRMMGGNREFIEHRKKALRRFLTLIARHPVISDDAIVKYFLTFKGTDMQHKMKEHFRGTPDEFMSCEFSLKAKELVPVDTQLQFSNSRAHINTLINSVSKMKDIAERLVLRATGYASDMLQLGKQLSMLSSDSTPVTTWACGSIDTWSHFKAGFKRLGVEYTHMADKASSLAAKEESGLLEILEMFLDLLYSYQDLCERHERGLLHDHQTALAKMRQYKKKKIGSTGTTVEQLEHRILQQENEISNMENRNCFSLYCIQMETQLIHANLEAMYIALQLMADNEGKGHYESVEGINCYKSLQLVVKAGLILAQTNAQSKKSLFINAPVVTQNRASHGESTIVGLHVVKEAVRIHDPVHHKPHNIPVTQQLKFLVRSVHAIDILGEARGKAVVTG
ncbi:hypothetical protein LSH36_386g02005, partial [Paralvinella palmiformis]